MLTFHGVISMKHAIMDNMYRKELVVYSIKAKAQLIHSFLPYMDLDDLNIRYPQFHTEADTSAFETYMLILLLRQWKSSAYQSHI